MTHESDYDASNFLKSCGWEMDRAFNWFSPKEVYSTDELEAINYLIHEWDYGYGGIIEKDTI